MRAVWAGALGAALLLVACAAPQPLLMQTKFDYDMHQPYTNKGNNTIEGQAFIQSLCGGYLPCVRDQVLLVPATLYFREELSIIKSGIKSIDNIDPTGKTMITLSQCDAQGNFMFRDVPDGNWFVVIKVKWALAFGYSPQGGVLIKEVSVANGETIQVQVTG